MREAYLFRLKFNTPYGVRVGGVREDINALTPLSVDGKYLIPASTWKGIFRRASEVLFATKEHFEGHRGEKVDLNVNVDLTAKGIESEEEKARFVAMWNCPIERLYGSEYFAGAVTFSDTVMEPVVYERMRVSIDRRTRKAQEHHLFREQVVDVRSVTVRVIVRDMLREFVQTLRFLSEVGTFIGGGKSVGVGHAVLDWKESEFAVARPGRITFRPLSEVDSYIVQK